MTFEIRTVTADELPGWIRTAEAAFGWTPSAEEIENDCRRLEVERSLAAVDRGRMVGATSAYSFNLTIPGPLSVPAAGVTAVGVLPTHRRRGILTALMRRQLAEMRERGESLAVLYASEAPIYGRFGYGAATTQADLHIDPRRVELREGIPQPGETTLVDRDEARHILPVGFDRFRREIPGQVDRPPGHWDAWFHDPDSHRGGASGRFYAVYTENGEHRGYAAYRVKGEWSEGTDGNIMRVTDLVATTATAYVGLWNYCLSVDLLPRVEVHHRPLDEPVRWMLSDSRQLRLRDVGDALWVRLADVAGALQARHYAVEGTLTLQIHDPFCPENTGIYRLDGGTNGATCRRVADNPDLSMGVDVLGSLYLGGITAGELARGGRIEQHRSGAVRRADLMFGTDQAPWCATHF